MAKPSGRCRLCGGGRAHHAVEESCWCPSCLTKPEADRCTSFAEETAAAKPKAPPKPSVDRNVARVGHAHPETAKAAAASVLPRSGTIRRAVFGVIAKAGTRGATDDEIERELGRTHQTVSGARNTLTRDDLVRDSGLRRKTRQGHDAIAWVLSDLSHLEEEEVTPHQGSLFDPDEPTEVVPERWTVAQRDDSLDLTSDQTLISVGRDAPCVAHVSQDGLRVATVTWTGPDLPRSVSDALWAAEADVDAPAVVLSVLDRLRLAVGLLRD